MPGRFNRPQLIDDAFLAAMEEFCFLGAGAQSAVYCGDAAFREELPGVPLVAVFETALTA